MVNFRLAPFHYFLSSFSSLVKLESFICDSITDNRNSLDINIIEFPFRVFSLQFGNHFVHYVKSDSHCCREMNVKDIVSGCKLRFKIITVFDFGNCAGCRKHAIAQHVIESMSVKLVKIDVWVYGFAIITVRHAYKFKTVFFSLFAAEIQIGICKKCQHRIII